MALNIRNEETEKLAETLAKLTGMTKTKAVTEALRDKLARIQRQHTGRVLADELDEIAQHCSSLPVLDHRDAVEIIGYDKNGVPR
jgi:antitoxin VapB